MTVTHVAVLQHEIAETRIGKTRSIGGRKRTVAVDGIAGSYTIACGCAIRNIIRGKLIQVIARDQSAHTCTEIGNTHSAPPADFTLDRDVVLLDSRRLQVKGDRVDCWLATEGRQQSTCERTRPRSKRQRILTCAARSPSAITLRAALVERRRCHCVANALCCRR